MRLECIALLVRRRAVRRGPGIILWLVQQFRCGEQSVLGVGSGSDAYFPDFRLKRSAPCAHKNGLTGEDLHPDPAACQGDQGAADRNGCDGDRAWPAPCRQQADQIVHGCVC